ncbi:DMT family transporter [Paracoccus sp. Arc7-R13]|uniref:DMT family transporter n=2 Tax=Paracoccus TaxID=265 RepID=UPI000FD93273|nr:DMT family transporter [Paracoccus sp. Arc7-R13]AZY94826.1 DMT family transporter [Paracoccus sp. Arc7-R13]TNC03836.1 DMT family transporter [Paracoccus marcusii]
MITARMSASDWGLLLLLSLIWGGSFFLIALIVGHMPVLWVVALRVMIAAAVLWAIVLATGRALPRGAGLWGAFLVMGVLNNAIPFGLIVWAQGFIPAGLASILNATTPLFTVLVSTLVLADERAGLMRLAGVALGLGGVAVMIGVDELAGHGHGVLPQLAMLGAAISYAWAAAFGRRFRAQGVDPLVTAAGMVTGTSAVLLPLALAHDGLPPAAPAQVWLAISLLGLVCTGLAYVLFFRILGRAGATNISLVTFLVPVSAILLGWLFLDEVLGLPQLLGMAVIGLGLAMIDGRLLRR